MDYQIRFTKGPSCGDIYQLPDNKELSIGRKTEKSHCDIQINSPTVSADHLRIYVDNDKANLLVKSKHRTLINGEQVPVPPSFEPYILDSGTVVTMGHETDFIVEAISTPESKEATVAPTVLGTRGNPTPEKPEKGGTVIYGKQGLDVEWANDARENRKRIAMLWGGMILCIVTLVIAYLVTFKKPVDNLIWLKEGKQWAKQKYNLEIQGINQTYTVECPRYMENSTRTEIDKETGETRFIVGTYAGQNRDVPCRVTVEYSQNDSLLTWSRQKSFEEWQKNRRKQEKWLFEEILPLKFSSPDAGVPYLSSFYTRIRENKKVFGYARYYRQANMQLVVFADMPDEERWRGMTFVQYPFLRANEHIAATHWEGDDMLETGSPDELLAETEQLLKEETPMNWGRIESCLQAALVYTFCKQDRLQQYEKAFGMLEKLRMNKKDAYNTCLLKIKQKKTPQEKEEFRKACINMFKSSRDRYSNLVQDPKWGKIKND